MKKWSKKELLDKGYELINMKINSIDLEIEDNILSLTLRITGGGRGVTLSPVIFNYKFKDESDNAGEFLLSILKVIAGKKYTSLTKLKDEYVRIAYMRGESVQIIGNIIYDEWFDTYSFFVNDEEKEESNNDKMD